MILVSSAQLDNLQIGSWHIERDGDCTYIGGSGDGQNLNFIARKTVDAGMKALSKVPQTLLDAVRARLDKEINNTLLVPYIAQGNELIHKLWPIWTGETFRQAGGGGGGGGKLPKYQRTR